LTIILGESESFIKHFDDVVKGQKVKHVGPAAAVFKGARVESEQMLHNLPRVLGVEIVFFGRNLVKGNEAFLIILLSLSFEEIRLLRENGCDNWLGTKLNCENWNGRRTEYVYIGAGF
jgi:hypothetical protein